MSFSCKTDLKHIAFFFLSFYSTPTIVDQCRRPAGAKNRSQALFKTFILLCSLHNSPNSKHLCQFILQPIFNKEKKVKHYICLLCAHIRYGWSLASSSHSRPLEMHNYRKIPPLTELPREASVRAYVQVWCSKLLPVISRINQSLSAWSNKHS